MFSYMDLQSRYLSNDRYEGGSENLVSKTKAVPLKKWFHSEPYVALRESRNHERVEKRVRVIRKGCVLLEKLLKGESGSMLRKI